MAMPASLRLRNSKGPRLKTIKSKKAERFEEDVDPYVTDLLEEIDDGKTVLRLRKDERVFSQGDSDNAIYFIQTGKVKITVVSTAGKEAVLAMLGPRGFLGEGSLVGHSLRLGTATAIQN